METEFLVPFICVPLHGKSFGGYNSSKALYHQARVSGREISLCIEASNGTLPTWFIRFYGK